MMIWPLRLENPDDSSGKAEYTCAAAARVNRMFQEKKDSVLPDVHTPVSVRHGRHLQLQIIGNAIGWHWWCSCQISACVMMSFPVWRWRVFRRYAWLKRTFNNEPGSQCIVIEQIRQYELSDDLFKPASWAPMSLGLYPEWCALHRYLCANAPTVSKLVK